MRYIDLNAAIGTIPANILGELKAADKDIETKSDNDKEIAASGGSTIWSKAKRYLAAANHQKCWYTESKNLGSDNDVEHFRPKGRIKYKNTGTVKHWYWFLAFNPSNYRFSCALSNQKRKNPSTGATGGKGDDFPLLNGTQHATNFAGLVVEQPALLDPCQKSDVELLAFLADGRPVVAPDFAQDQIIQERVQKSNLLLNLDFPNFNEERERLYNKIHKKVTRGDEHFNAGNIVAVDDVIGDLKSWMAADAEYSKAAECYIRGFRDREWVDNLFT